MKIHHIGYLVKNIRVSQEVFLKLGYTLYKPTVYDEYRKIHICFLKKDQYLVELVSPATPDSVVSSLIKQYRNAPYHICYVSDTFEQDVTKLCLNGFVQIDIPCIAPALENKKVVFLMSPAIGLLEILEE